MSYAFEHPMVLFLYLPIIIGTVMLIFAKPLGVAFCRSGKGIWRMLTFGLTDMGRFYNQKRAPITMRIIGAGFLLFGIVFLYEAGFPFKGPNRFKATIEAKEYLTNVYGSQATRGDFRPRGNQPTTAL